MQNKGFVLTFAIALVLVCAYHLSFTLVANKFNNRAKHYAESYAVANADGDDRLYQELYNKQYNHYLDSMSTEKVYLSFGTNPKTKEKRTGYTLKECRDNAIGLGLDLEGGMSVIVEVDVVGFLRTVGDTNDAAFDAALTSASLKNKKEGSNKAFISLFYDQFKSLNGEGKLAAVFATKLKDQISLGDSDSKVLKVLDNELSSVADNSFNVLRSRIDRFGVVAPNVQKLDNRTEQILIELPGIKEPERVRKLLQGSANLQFWKTYELNQITEDLTRLDELSRNALANVDSISSDSVKSEKQYALGYNRPFFEYIASNIPYGRTSGATIGIFNRVDTAGVNHILNAYASQIRKGNIQFAWGVKAVDQREQYVELFALQKVGRSKGPALDGEVVASAKADLSERGNGWAVSMTMNNEGARRWADITGESIGQPIAIVMDGFVYSAPNVNARIEGGSSVITGNFTKEEANDLENVLKSGKMKVGVHIVKEDVVGPSLGKEAIDAGIYSFIIALGLLMIYICLIYGLVPGLVANAALILNLFITIGTLSAMGAVLTLPGITGLILSLAMAVDANVLIYERIKEELRAGKKLKVALADGYKQAFSAIFDANVTSIITAIILIIFGTGAIRGFATVLIIGIIASFITAIFLTRIFYDYTIEKGKLRNLTFTTSISKNLFVNTKYNFLKHYKTFFIVSSVVCALGIGSLFVLKLDYGIDFTGGRNYLVRFDNIVTTESVRKALETEFEGSNITVLTSGSATASAESSQIRISTNYKHNETSDETEAEIKGKLTTALQPFMQPGQKIDTVILSSQQVGPSIAQDMKSASIAAVVIAICAMALYILFRFRDWAFSIGTFAAVCHDVFVVITLYSLFWRIMPFSMEMNQEFIAAMLTIIGYSINDKVVIFDRMREIKKLYPKRNITEVVNESLNSTLGRTINTSLSTMIVIFCIFLFGGDAIRSFTFAIFLGVFIGTYSSLFIATPIAWLMLDKKQKKNQTSPTNEKLSPKMA